MRQKTKNYRIRGSNAQKIFFLFYFPSHIPIWVWFVQKTRAKNSHAWAPLSTILSQVGHSQLIASSLLTDPTLIKKENKISLIYKEIQKGAVAKSYMNNGLLLYG